MYGGGGLVGLIVWLHTERASRGWAEAPMALLGSVKLCIHSIPIQLSSPKLGQMGYMGWTPVGLSLVHTQS